MKLKVAPVLLPALVGAVAAAFVRVSMWDSIKTRLITALSVAAAAALVRLSRGLPFTTASHFETDEIEKITKAVIQLDRSLRSFLAVTVLTMGLLLSTTPAMELGRTWSGSASVLWGGRLLSAILGAVVAYVVVRLFQIVGSDLSLLTEQSILWSGQLSGKTKKRVYLNRRPMQAAHSRRLITTATEYNRKFHGDTTRP